MLNNAFKGSLSLVFVFAKITLPGSSGTDLCEDVMTVLDVSCA